MKKSKRWLLLSMNAILSLCLLTMAIGLGCSVKKVPKPSPNVSGESGIIIRKDETPVPADHADAAPTPSQNEITSPAVLTIHPPLGLRNCPNLPPICAGGILNQDATIEHVLAYRARYNTAGCRWMQPPRCYTGQKRSCLQECTP